MQSKQEQMIESNVATGYCLTKHIQGLRVFVCNFLALKFPMFLFNIFCLSGYNFFKLFNLIQTVVLLPLKEQ